MSGPNTRGVSSLHTRNQHAWTRLVEEAHQETLHGGVGLTMAKVRTRYWIPKLRQLVKEVRKGCLGARGFKHRRMQLRRLETCQLPGRKEPTHIK